VASSIGPYTVDVVIPCYNEEGVIPRTVVEVLDLVRSYLARPDLGLSSFRILLVDDGSKDGTWAQIAALAGDNPEVVGIKLTKNYGHQAALLAGLSHVEADACISIDADLQDDPHVMEDMLKGFEGGNDLVLGIRSSREPDSRFKRGTAVVFYKLMSFFGTTAIPNHADFRLMSNRALEALLAHKEVNLFLRGLISTIGFRTLLVPYKRKPRHAGETKYSLHKMVALAIDGVTSFSVTPLRIISVLGAMVFAFSGVIALYVLIIRIFTTQATVGWASTLLPILMLGGLQILSIGVLGEYIGKTYLEVKRRPLFFVERTIDRTIVRGFGEAVSHPVRSRRLRPVADSADRKPTG